MNYDKIKIIYEHNQKTSQNTYLVPVVSFEGFIRDELTFVRKADGSCCTIWRSMNGKLYDLTADQLKNFKCVGSCKV